MALINASILIYVLSPPLTDIANLQRNADLIGSVRISNIQLDGETIIRAEPIFQIRGTNKKPFRVWIPGVHYLKPGTYVLFYHLCEGIGYPTLNQSAVLPVRNNAIDVQTPDLMWLTVQVSDLAGWMRRHHLYQTHFRHQCLPGRKGLP